MSGMAKKIPISKSRSDFTAGALVIGKWNKRQYMIVRELGSGANGSVFLAKGVTGRYVAIKFSDNSTIIANESNVLKSLDRQSSFLGPALLDIDDYESSGVITPFYVMEYIEGDSLLDFVAANGSDSIPHLICDLLGSLATLHDEGWIFGDLKPENLIVEHTGRVRLIDVGGTTKSGRAIKEFTDFFDRGYWGMGDRKANIQYDLFAVAMIAVNASYGRRPAKKKGGLQELITMIKKHSVCARLQPVLLQAISGKFTSASEMKRVFRTYCRKVSRKNKQTKLEVLQPNKLEAITWGAVAIGLYLLSQI